MRSRSSARCLGGASQRRRTQLRLALLIAGALASQATPALQIVEARDGVAVEAILSIKEATRIRIENAPITDVFGNIHSSNCAAPATTLPGAGNASTPINPAGEVVLECDRDKGEIYVRPMGDGTKPVNLFISSAQATYTLLLRRSDTPADTIVIRDRSVRPMPPAAQASAQTRPLGPSPHHVRAMKAMLVAMASDDVPADIAVDELNRPLQLWAEARFTLLRRFDGRGLIGEQYRLVNISAKPMVLAEPEFDRENAQVIGVAIERHNLLPGDSTTVYVIRRGAAR